ncbi:MAG: C40 family peptidase [Brachybacterium alimentarium]|uniref:C40 family peptidase n=1 Tax=Brachybacterium alimentarium TaxID=47845 RepID=UPI0015F0B33D|nr:C40 family peptidase [Brachybacterium alimentarium]
MSKTANNTHRRAMRTVTPAVRAGRASAGAAMAAAMLFGGAAAATAEPQADAPQAEGAPQAASAVIPAVAAPATTLTSIPAQGKASSKAKEETPQLTPAAGTLSVKVGPTEEEIAAAAAERAAEQEAAERAAAEEAENSADEQDQADDQDQAEDTTETRDEDDSANRSNERSSRDDSSNSSSSDNSSSEEKKEEKSSPAPSAGKGSSILATARSGIGTPYVYGGTSTSGWDCSGFVQWVYAQHGINLPRGAADQAAAGTVIPRSEAQPGDLVYKPGHIGIYVGGNTFVDAGNSRVDTSERNIYSGSWTFIRVGS